jgi:hypothetical protein
LQPAARDPFDPACLASARFEDLALLPLSAHAIFVGFAPPGCGLIPMVTHQSAFGYAIGPLHTLRAWSHGHLADGSKGLSILGPAETRPWIKGRNPIVKKPTTSGADPGESMNLLGIDSGVSTDEALWQRMLAHARTGANHHRTEAPMEAAKVFGSQLPWLSMPARPLMASALRMAVCIGCSLGAEREGKPAKAWRDKVQALALDAVFSSWAGEGDRMDFAVARLALAPDDLFHEDDLGSGPFGAHRLISLAGAAQSRLELIKQALL